ncbi:MAG TPA: hypothetical protein VK184_07655 [Nostocaceae cyanobacterium]|nr:hypothetical protein [Nostocaceae cyanobacterium]
MKYIVLALITIVAILPIGIGLASTPKFKFYKDPDIMEQEISRFIPTGTSIVEAKKIMERNRFKCEYSEKDTFARTREVPDTSVPEAIFFRNVDFLLCNHSKGFIVTQDWIVGIFHENGLVTNVAVNYGLTGP